MSSGIEICRRVKADPQTRQIPYRHAVGPLEEVDRVRGLETGADDYGSKPYSVVELMARLRTQYAAPGLDHGRKAQLRRHHSGRRRTSGVAAASRCIWVRPEFRLLSTPMESWAGLDARTVAGPGLGRDIYVDSRTIDVHVGRLRKALMAHGGDNPVRTVRGTGYSLG